MQTADQNKEFVNCSQCGKVIAELQDDGMNPKAEDCYKSGNVPVPNFGWFCSQECAVEYEKSHDVRFARTIDGRIDYYL